MDLTPTSLDDEMSLQTNTDWKEQQLTGKENGFLHKRDATEGAAWNSLKEITRRNHVLDRLDDEDDAFSENSQTDFFHKADTKNWDTLEQEAEYSQDPQSEQDEQETETHEEPPGSTSVQFSEENTPDLCPQNMFFRLNYWNTKMDLEVQEVGTDHVGWLEKINSIIRKINVTENTVKSLLNEVMYLEEQTEMVEDQDLDPNQGVYIEVGVCNEANALKEKFIERMEDFCKDMALLNRKLRLYQMREGNTDSEYSPEELDVEETESQLLQAPPPALGQNSPPCVTVWKCALRIFIMFYVLVFTGLSCYTLFFDATFIFERVLPRMLGRRTMWELREIIAPFLNLQVEDLLPS
ncbi:single-pass membrane and coiled-coil domain-containing protein 2 isoform X2 [Nycticebus coucang]|uniref:single-pass membrane and coiled-coil domain-containing protein 2 isoform X2 n=1 Tax=Nycticebus coucang TaxID=9470 RepID=UPI00234D2F0E|nr:single-pass membrane and coiled-coil domain-containing protein 2 isoform X2 [Nycticebus coucang]